MDDVYPWGHVALGYLLYAAWRRARRRPAPGDVAAVALVVGTQCPDLIDKPLAWTVAVLPSGRSLAHSLVVLVPVTLLALLALATGVADDDARRVDGADAALPFLFGWYAHLVGDAYAVLLPGETCVSYLLWPVAPVCSYPEGEVSIVGVLTDLTLTPSLAFEFLLVVAAAAVWYRNGCPGVRPVVSRVCRAAANRSE